MRLEAKHACTAATGLSRARETKQRRFGRVLCGALNLPGARLLVMARRGPRRGTGWGGADDGSGMHPG